MSNKSNNNDIKNNNNRNTSVGNYYPTVSVEDRFTIGLGGIDAYYPITPFPTTPISKERLPLRLQL